MCRCQRASLPKTRESSTKNLARHILSIVWSRQKTKMGLFSLAVAMVNFIFVLKLSVHEAGKCYPLFTRLILPSVSFELGLVNRDEDECDDDVGD